jgi:hypothetical protein
MMSLSIKSFADPASGTLLSLQQSLHTKICLPSNPSPKSVVESPAEKTKDVQEAINQLFVCMLHLPKLQEGEIKSLYALLFSLFPYFDDADFAKFRQTNESEQGYRGYLQELLNASSTLKKEQQKLSLFLAYRSLKQAQKKSSPMKLLDYQDAMNYFAKAIKISRIGGDLLSERECHLMASEVFVDLLQTYFLNVETYKKTLMGAVKGSKVKYFDQLFSHVAKAKRFCIQEKDRQIIHEAYNSVSTVITDIPLIVRGQYIPFSGEALKFQDEHFALSTKLVTEDYSEKLLEYRKNYTDFLSIRNPSVEQVRTFQKDIIAKLRTLLDGFLQDAFSLLGPPPCGYSLQCMGSVGREEPCPYSDLEFFLIIEELPSFHKQEYENYFKDLVKMLTIQLISLGETASKDVVFTCLETINSSGFHIDAGGSPDREPSFLGTARTLAKNQNQEGEPGTPAQTLRHSITLDTNNPQLFENYQSARMELVKAQARTSVENVAEGDKLPVLSLASSALSSNIPAQEDPSFAQKFGEAFQPNRLALKLFETRLQDYQKAWASPSFEVLHLKQHYVELLHLLIADMAIYYNISATNTLDIIDELTRRELITERSGHLLKKAAAFIYTLRLNVHLGAKKQEEEVYRQSQNLSDHILKAEELFQLKRAYYLVLRPLYAALDFAFKKPNKEIFFPHKLDLLDKALEEAMSAEKSPEAKSMTYHLVTYLAEIDAPNATYVAYFKKLSVELKYEGLRETYYNVLKEKLSANLIHFLEMIPSQAGFRYAFNSHAAKLLDSLIKLTSNEPAEKTAHVPSLNHPIHVRISGPSFQSIALRPEVVAQLLDENGDIRNSYPGSLHRVTAVGGLHFKQKPTHPLMEYAIHNLFFRLGGDLTPSTQLLRFEVTVKGREKIYPVLVSQTIPGKTLKEAVKKDLQLTGSSWARWTWMSLGSALTKPGDGRFSNYILDERKNIYCIDNDISFVEPVLRQGLSKKVFFCSALFCVYMTSPLDKSILQEFCSLDVDLILNGWIDEVIQKEQDYLALFSEQEREQLYNEDPDNRFKATILFKEGSLATLNLQFFYLQKQISSMLLLDTDITPSDLLKMLINIREKPSADNSPGVYVSQSYKKAYALSSPDERLKKAVDRVHDQSLTSIQSDHASVGKIPTFAEVEKLQMWTPSKAKEELLATLLFRLNQLYPFMSHGVIDGKKTLKVSFKEISHQGKADEARQKLILQGLANFVTVNEERLVAIAFLHCSVLNTETLDPFLHPITQYIDLLFCPQILDRDIDRIQTKCPNLKELRLEGCPGIKSLTRGLFGNSPLPFTQLEFLEVKDCSQLSTLYFDTSSLKTLIIKKAPVLRSVTTNAQNLQKLELSHCPLLPQQEILKLLAWKALVELRLNGCSLLKYFESIPRHGRDKTPEGTLPPAEPLMLRFRKLETVYIANCESLISIDFQSPKLSHLTLMNNPALTYLIIFDQLHSFPHLKLDSCPKLNVRKCLNEIFNWLIPRNRLIFPKQMEIWMIEILADFIVQEIYTEGLEAATRKYIDPLFQLVEISKKDPQMATTAANAITILNFAGIPLAGKNFQGIHIPGANLGRACLKKADLRGADLKGVCLSEAELDHCQLAGANMQHVEMRPEVIWCESSVNCLIVDGTGKQWIVAVENDISIVDMETGREAKKLLGHTSSVTTLAVLEGGKKLASGSADKSIRVWEMETGRVLKKLLGHTSSVTTLAMLEGGKKLASGSADSIRVWEVETGKEVKKLEGHTDSVRTLAVLEGGKKLASGSADKSIRVWEMETGRVLKKLLGHTSSVRTLAVLEGGKKLVSGSNDWTIRVWEMETGRELFAISTLTSIRSLTFKEPDLLYAGDASGGLWCWKLNLDDRSHPYSLQWTHRPNLSCQGVKLGDISNLSELNKRIMLEHGAV